MAAFEVKADRIGDEPTIVGNDTTRAVPNVRECGAGETVRHSFFAKSVVNAAVNEKVMIVGEATGDGIIDREAAEVGRIVSEFKFGEDGEATEAAPNGVWAALRTEGEEIGAGKFGGDDEIGEG